MFASRLQPVVEPHVPGWKAKASLLPRDQGTRRPLAVGVISPQAVTGDPIPNCNSVQASQSAQAGQSRTPPSRRKGPDPTQLPTSAAVGGLCGPSPMIALDTYAPLPRQRISPPTPFGQRLRSRARPALKSSTIGVACGAPRRVEVS